MRPDRSRVTRVAQVATPAAWWWARPGHVLRRLVVQRPPGGEVTALDPAMWAVVATAVDEVLRLARRRTPALSSASVRIDLETDLDDTA